MAVPALEEEHMHPDMMRDLMNQHGGELRAQARNATLARNARKGLRWWRGRAADELVLPRIPDYVDGTFRDAKNIRGEHTGRAGGRAA
jgi:hypothetical protein